MFKKFLKINKLLYTCDGHNKPAMALQSHHRMNLFLDLWCNPETLRRNLDNEDMDNKYRHSLSK